MVKQVGHTVHNCSLASSWSSAVMVTSLEVETVHEPRDRCKLMTCKENMFSLRIVATQVATVIDAGDVNCPLNASKLMAEMPKRSVAHD